MCYSAANTLRSAALLSISFTSTTPSTVQLISSPMPTEMPLVMQADGGAGRGVREHDGNLNADDHCVEQHRGQAGGNGQTLEAHIAQLVGDQTGQQGGQRAKDHIHDGGAQQVCKEAAQHNTHDVLGTEHGQQAQSLGHAHLHSTIGEGLQCQTQHYIDSCHYTAVHQFTDGRILIHDNTPAG